MKFKIIVFLGLIINILLALYFYFFKKPTNKPTENLTTEDLKKPQENIKVNDDDFSKVNQNNKLAVKRDIVIKALIKNIEITDQFTNKTLYDNLADKDKEFFQEITIAYFSQVIDKLTKENYFSVEKQGRIKVYTYQHSLDGIIEKSELETKLGYCNYLAKNENCLNKGNPNKLDLIKVKEKTPVAVGSMEFTSVTERYVCKNCYEKFFK